MPTIQLSAKDGRDEIEHVWDRKRENGHKLTVHHLTGTIEQQLVVKLWKSGEIQPVQLKYVGNNRTSQKMREEVHRIFACR